MPEVLLTLIAIAVIAIGGLKLIALMVTGDSQVFPEDDEPRGYLKPKEVEMGKAVSAVIFMGLIGLLPVVVRMGVLWLKPKDVKK